VTNRLDFRRSYFVRPGFQSGTIALALALAGALPVKAADPSAAATGTDIIGLVGRQQISEADVIAANQADFDRLQSSQQREQRQLELKFAQSRHELLQQRLDKLLDARALELEAKKRNVGTDKVLAGLKLEVPTENDVRSFYEANKDRIRQPYEDAAPKVRQYLASQRNQTVTRRFYDELRTNNGISAKLGPYRLPVEASGPVRGQNKAAVTIVEFGDFQCPYCREAESSLRTVMEHHPQDVRLVFRNLPLTQIHPNAKVAAEAAVCADRQGRFWEMHDAMYEDQSALTADALKMTATRLGLDAGSFAACLTDDSTARSLAADAEAARELGLSGTPYFFINGRPIDGNVPVEKFESVIADELHRAAGDRG
jgi:protein-disulfide isomerase